MAEFFKKISKSISDTSKNVKESVADSREKSALRRQLAAANNKIEQIKISMGDKLYEAYVKNVSLEDCEELCRQIDELNIAAEKYKAQILAIDGIKICAKCGLEISAESMFCSHCGARQFNERTDEHEEEKTETTEEDRGYVDVGN